MQITYTPIGVIHSPFQDIAGMPIQPAGAEGVRGRIDIHPEFSEGLQSLAGFSHIILLYHFHQAGESRLLVTPFLDTEERGVFSTRAPLRPNPIGLSVVRLIEVDGNRLVIENVDILDGTPLLDIKPYLPAADAHQPARMGWLEQAGEKMKGKRADSRFR